MKAGKDFEPVFDLTKVVDLIAPGSILSIPAAAAFSKNFLLLNIISNVFNRNDR